MNLLRPVIAGALACGALAGAEAQAMSCGDPAWTHAITEAMGRPPHKGECNTRLYGTPHTHEERVAVIRKVLGEIYRSCGGDVEWITQKLPLHVCQQTSKTAAQR